MKKGGIFIGGGGGGGGEREGGMGRVYLWRVLHSTSVLSWLCVYLSMKERQKVVIFDQPVPAKISCYSTLPNYWYCNTKYPYTRIIIY